MVATGALMGFAFLAKELQAFTVLPAFVGVYLLAAPAGLRRRLWQLALGGAALVASAGWWVTIVALWPASSPTVHRRLADQQHSQPHLRLQRPEPSVRRRRRGRGSNFSGATGIFRLFNDLMGGQAAWLLPASLLRVGRRRRMARQGPSHRPHPGRVGVMGWVAARDRRRVQLRRRRHPHLLHGGSGPRHRRPCRHRERVGLAATTPPGCPPRRFGRHRRDRRVVRGAARPDAGIPSVGRGARHRYWSRRRHRARGQHRRPVAIAAPSPAWPSGSDCSPASLDQWPTRPPPCPLPTLAAFPRPVRRRASRPAARVA